MQALGNYWGEETRKLVKQYSAFPSSPAVTPSCPLALPSCSPEEDPAGLSSRLSQPLHGAALGAGSGQLGTRDIYNLGHTGISQTQRTTDMLLQRGICRSFCTDEETSGKENRLVQDATVSQSGHRDHNPERPPHLLSSSPVTTGRQLGLGFPKVQERETEGGRE